MLSAELLELVKKIQENKAEFQSIEVKAAGGGAPKSLYDTLSSFSNQDSGGTIVFGLDEEKNFELCGVNDYQSLQKAVAEQCLQMEPPVRAVFTLAEIDEKKVVSAEIPSVELSRRPCYYKGKGKYRGSYIRVGEADMPMTDYEIYSFEAFRQHTHDDERTVERADVKTLDRQKIEAFIRENKVNRPGFAAVPDGQAYELLNIMRDGRPTLASVLNFAVFPQAFFPQLCITAVAVPGCAVGDEGNEGERFSDNKRIEGTIADMVEGAVDFCRRNMRVRTIVGEDGRRKDRPEYPVVAIREGVLNALIHRDYSVHTEGTTVQINIYYDRMEIHSPGTLYGRMTVEQLGETRPDLRNPTLAVIAESQTQAENRYSGIPTMRRAMKEYGLPEPLFENRRNEFVVTLYNEFHEVENVTHEKLRRADIKKQGNVQELIVEFCRTPKSRQEISDFLGMKTTVYAMEKYVSPMVEEGIIRMTLPEKPKSKKQRYYASETSGNE